VKILLTILLLIASTLTTRSQDKNELLFKAVLEGDKTKVEKLIKEGADVNYTKEVRPSWKMNLLITSITNKQFAISKVLIENKADVNWKDAFKTSAILYAASSGNVELVKLLLANGANINDNDGQGNSVLSAARESENEDMIKFVTEKIREEK
jgi:ankyrin repeat protein